MKKTDSGFGNRDSVPSLASKQAEVNNLLNEQPSQARESDMPLSEAKNTATSTELKADILNAAVVLTAGYLSRKLNASVSLSPIKKLVGNVLIIGITYLVTKKTGAIKSVGKHFKDVILGELDSATNVQVPNALQPIVRN